ncbi:ABC transporter permease [Streptomyces sp. NPDC090022]|uniref:ABC transporter permease n=1 Tax=Streptomyces sp. NPDC090022 TaxID=3365920 RepID=UPI003822A650
MTAPTAPTAPPAYRSPHSGPRPNLAHAVASEWTKLISVRSTLWTLGSLIALVCGIGTLAITQTSARDYEGMPFTAPAVFGLLVGQVPVMVLGVLTMTSEHGTGLIRTTFTAAPDRFRVLTAKYLVFTGTAFGVVAGSVGLVSLAAAIVHDGPAAGVHHPSEWAGAFYGSVYITLLGVLGLAIGALVRHSAGAIAVMIGIITLPPVIGAMLTSWTVLAPVGTAVLRYNAPVALMQLFGLPNGDGVGATSDGAQLMLLLLVAGAAVAGSYAVVGRRDV